MDLFRTAFLIASRYSSRRLLYLFGVFIICAGIMGGVLAAQDQHRSSQFTKAVVGVWNEDESPLTQQVLKSVVSTDLLSSLVELRFLETPDHEPGEYTAFVTIPNGFMQSVMDGTNLSPYVEIDLKNPLSAVLARQMLRTGTRALSSAQQGIYAVQECLSYGKNMDHDKYKQLVQAVNLKLIMAFLDRLSNIKTVTLSAAGVLSLPEYFITALAGLLLLCYGFLYGPAIQNLKKFSIQSKKSLPLFAAAALHVFLLNFLICLMIMAAISALGGQFMIGVALICALLATSFSLLLALAFPRQTGLAAGSILLALAMGLCSGAFMPLALMPAFFTTLASFLPAGQMHMLFSSAFGAPIQAIWQPLLMSAVLLVSAWLLWNQRGGRRMA